jgi:predicted Zn-dependent protease
MKFFKSYAIILFALTFFMLSCSTVPITGRKQLNLVPPESMLSMSFEQYDKFLKEHKLSTDKGQTLVVKRTGQRIQKAVEQYFIENRMSYKLRNYKWDFNLVENEEENAWCMPGGKVVIYTGILKYTKDETGLAVVMSHEIAHAIAGHGNERMSQFLALQMGGTALSTALSSQPSETQKLWMTAFGVGAQVGFILPYSRIQEYEADHLGLIFMARAGYDPEGAISFWSRMSQKKEGPQTPVFLSTHPSDTMRINKIKELIPKAKKYYIKAR